MHGFETILTVMAAAVAMSLLAQKLKAPFPPFVALAGAMAAFLPFAPELTLDPPLVLALFVAPVLLDAAFDSSLRDLKRNVVPIALLSLVAVVITTLAVALTAKMLVPGLLWPAAVALGAIVAPPDAAAATAVLRIIPAPFRIRTVLEGESLFNDAGALLIYKLAVLTMVAAMPVGWSLGGTILLATAGSVLFGLIAAWMQMRIVRLLTEAPPAIVMQFVGGFGLWIMAEHLGLSAIITIVVFALAIARMSARTSAVFRVPAYAVWETAVFALNVLAFTLVGLQIGPIWRGLEDAQRQDYLVFGLIVLGVCVLVRLVWVMGYNGVAQLRNRLIGRHLARASHAPSFAAGLVIGWAGMRGVVSLAAAYALPMNFPYRDLILLAVFTVVMGTLVVQGLTLGPLIRLMGLRDDGVLAGEIRKARAAIADAAIAHVSDRDDPPAKRLKAEYHERRAAVDAACDGDGRVALPVDDLAGEVLQAKRDRLLDMRLSGEISDAAYYQIEEELDRRELALTPVVR
ncbi:cation:proton antiporter [Brevundimonas sp.]|uniref:cation:proton antiporter n=1 Tax=Brevundimonas sp. TaxID=1871086 RepID=UPI003F708B80